MIEIFQPPSDNELTGGYLYNRRICEALGTAHVHAVAAPALVAAVAAHTRPGSHVLVDSLYIAGAFDLDALARCAPVALVHGLPSLDPGFPDAERAAQRRHERAFLATASRIVVTSEFMRALVAAELSTSRVIAAPPGVDEAFFAVDPAPPRAASPRRIVTVANLAPHKGHLAHIEPLARLAADLDVHWHLVGAISDAAYAADLRAAIERAGLAPRVTWHSRLERDALCGLLARARVHLFPTRFESYGMAVAESLAAGVPVVAPRLGELARIVGHGETGLLAEPGDPRALIAALARVLRDDDLHAHLRRGCLARRDHMPRWPTAATRLRHALEEDAAS